MEKISVQRFREAMVVVLTYCDQVQQLKDEKCLPCDVGCRVRVRDSSIETLGGHMRKRRGKTVDYLPWGSANQSKTDGLATVKWDGVKTPYRVHVGHLVRDE